MAVVIRESLEVFEQMSHSMFDRSTGLGLNINRSQVVPRQVLIRSVMAASCYSPHRVLPNQSSSEYSGDLELGQLQPGLDTRLPVVM